MIFFSKSGFGKVKSLTSDAPTLLDYKDFNYDSCSLIEYISLLQSVLNSTNSYEQNKAFTKHIVEAMMKALEEELELEIFRFLENYMMNGNPPLKSKSKIMSAMLYVIWVLVFP